MKQAQILLIFFLVLFFSEKGKGQEQEIDLVQPDLKLLEHYIKLYTDSVRLAHGLTIQNYENALYLAADDHARYLHKSGVLSHNQADQKDKIQPKDRVKFYKGEFSYLFENLAQVTLISLLDNKRLPESNFQRVLWSYERTAQFVVEGWVNSPGHYQNLINEHSTHTAIAVQLNKNDGSLYAVQLFSKPENKVSSKAEYFPYQHLSLTPISFNFLPAEKINKRLDKYGKYARKIKVSRGVFSTSFKTARRLFKWHKRNSGLIFESENDELYYGDVDAVLIGETRANGLHYYNTDKEYAVNRKELFKSARSHAEDKDYVKLFGIKLPFIKQRAAFLFLLPSVNFSDLLVTDGKYPYYLIGSVSVPSGNYEMDFISFDFEPQNYERLAPQINTSRNTHSFKIYFEPNAINSIDFEETYELIKEVLRNPKNVLDTVFLNATASVEGSQEANKKLFYQRARSIYDSLPVAYTGKKPALKVVTKENWEMMAGQLKGSPYNLLIKESKDSVRSFMTANRGIAPFQTWLDEQRFANLELVITTYDTIPSTLSLVEEQYREAINSFLNNSRSKAKRDSLLTLQSAYFNAYNKRGNQKLQLKRVGSALELVPFRIREIEYLLSKGKMDEKTAFEECSEIASMLKIGELYLLKDLHMQLLVNLSLREISSQMEAPDLNYLDQFYRLYHKPKIYERWKESGSEYLFQSTLNNYYKRLIEIKAPDLFPAALNHHWGNYYLRELEKESRNSLMVTSKHIRHLSNFKRSYVDKVHPLSTGEALQIGLYFSRYYQYDWALEMFKKIPSDNMYGPRAAKVSAAIYLSDSKNDREEVLMDLYKKLGRDEWCEFMRNSTYYSYQKHLYYQSRKLYCEECIQ